MGTEKSLDYNTAFSHRQLGVRIFDAGVKILTLQASNLTSCPMDSVQKIGPVHSWPGVKMLTPRLLCENPCYHHTRKHFPLWIYFSCSCRFLQTTRISSSISSSENDMRRRNGCFPHRFPPLLRPRKKRKRFAGCYAANESCGRRRAPCGD